MANKLNLGIVFGGRSGEHEVSLVSATSVINSLDKAKYNIIPIGITKEGRWFAGRGVMEALKSGKTPPANQEIIISPDPTRKGFIKFGDANRQVSPLDAVFPVLHGTFGEDGTIQGLFELASIACVGAGVLASSVGMDKIIQKELLGQAGIKVAPSIWFLSKEYERNQSAIVKDVEVKLGYPCFIKPSNLGSSVGITKAHNQKELKNAITDAARYDRRVLVEKGIEGAREIELSVLGNDEPKISCPGEVIASNEFYDYDAKYVDGKSKTIAPADLPANVTKKIQETALKAFRATDCAGMARIDFLVAKNDFYLIEVNTIPGFTSISMYPKLWEASGLPYSKLLDELISLAIERHNERSKLLTNYKPKEEWYK